jgi:hypothetical protein
MDDLAIVIFTHSACKDAWPITNGTYKKHAKHIKKYVITNEESDLWGDEFTQVVYTDGRPYTVRFLQGMESVKENYIIAVHEDFFLYADVNMEMVKSYVNFMKTHEDAVYIKLLKSGDVSGEVAEDEPTIRKFPRKSLHLFAVQTTLWKKDILMKVYKDNQSRVPCEMERPHTQDYMRTNNYIGYYHDHPECNKRGKQHWDSIIFPYTATGIAQGRWNYSEYRMFFDKVFKEYSIDLTKRRRR